jgi:hypothetical protein
VTAKALPLGDLLDMTAGEMLALKRRGMLPSIAENLAEVILEDDPGPSRGGGRRLMQNCFGAVFWGSDPPTDFEALVEALTKILSDYASDPRPGTPECREKVEAIVTARRKSN